MSDALNLDRLLSEASHNYQTRRKFENAMNRATFFVPLFCDKPLVDGVVQAGSKISLFARTVGDNAYAVLCSTKEAADKFYAHRNLFTECHGSKATAIDAPGVFFQGTTGCAYYSRDELKQLASCAPSGDNDWSVGPGRVTASKPDPLPMHILLPLNRLFEQTPEVERARCSAWLKDGISSLAIGVSGGTARALAPKLSAALRHVQRPGELFDLIVFEDGNAFKESEFRHSVLFYERGSQRAHI